MSKLYIEEVFTKKQKAVFTKLKPLKQIGVLSGGTALIFQLKHRRSYDFDIFTQKAISLNLAWKVRKIFDKIEIIQESENELTFFTPSKVKITFFYYPFKPLYKTIKTSSISIFDWKDIAADKAYTLGRRPIWRDYVDLFFIIKKGYGLKKIISDVQRKFQGLFSEKLFLGQLIYFGDLQDFKIDFLSKSIQPDVIKRFFEKEVKKYKNVII